MSFQKIEIKTVLVNAACNRAWEKIELKSYDGTYVGDCFTIRIWICFLIYCAVLLIRGFRILETRFKAFSGWEEDRGSCLPDNKEVICSSTHMFEISKLMCMILANVRMRMWVSIEAIIERDFLDHFLAVQWFLTCCQINFARRTTPK